MITRRDVALAGHQGDEPGARAGLSSNDPSVRATALGALERLHRLPDDVLIAAFADASPVVRRRAAEIAAAHRAVSVLPLLADVDSFVVEMAAWSCGEHEQVDDETLARLIELGSAHQEPLVREAAVAALGAIGDERGLSAILHGTADKPAIRRRAVIALAPFDGPEVDAALQRALTDRDWQVRQAAEVLVSDD